MGKIPDGPERRSRLWVPPTPGEARIARVARSSLPPPNHPSYGSIMEALRLERERDPILRLALDRLTREINMRLQVMKDGGSGLAMAEHLRSLALEFASRLLQHGIFVMPASFNVGEMFVQHNPRLAMYELLPEREFLLFANSYLDWYTDPRTSQPSVGELRDAMDDGVIYSFNMVNDAQAMRVDTVDSSLVMVGASFVRRDSELGAVILFGEDPPCPQIGQYEICDTPPAKQNIKPHPGYSAKDRLIPGYPDLGRLFVMTSFDLASLTHSHRYIFQDIGPSYLVYTDDVHVFNTDGTDDSRSERVNESMRKSLDKYSDAFSLLASAVFLPVLVERSAGESKTERFATRLNVDRRRPAVRSLAKSLGREHLPLHRDVVCLPAREGSRSNPVPAIPPKFRFEASGFWQEIGPTDIGRDQNGDPVVGRTWVERVDTSMAAEPHDFLLQVVTEAPGGADAGIIYVMRSPEHLNETYKIGLTQRTTKERRSELSSSTGVPAPFGVLAQWDVSDCRKVERVVHDRLDDYRINKSREFFRCPLDHIIRVINSSVDELRSSPE